MPVTHDQTAKISARRHLDFCEVQMRKAAEYGDQAAVRQYADIIQKTLASLNALLKESGDRRKKAPQKKRDAAAPRMSALMNPLGGLEGLPSTLATVMGLQEINTDNMGLVGIYFLCSGGEVIYVGKSANVARRITQHRYSKDFDKVFVLACPPEQLDEEERRFIEQLQPKLNKR